MIKFSFTDSQRGVVYAEALRREEENVKKGRKGRNGAPSYGPTSFFYNLIGAAGEFAVASWLGLENQVFTNKDPIRGSSDLPGKIEVKTRSKHGYELLVQMDDIPDKTFVLVTIEGKETRIVGFIEGQNAMNEKYIKTWVKGRTCYSIPQSDLQNIDLLPEFLKNKLSAVLC